MMGKRGDGINATKDAKKSRRAKLSIFVWNTRAYYGRGGPKPRPNGEEGGGEAMCPGTSAIKKVVRWGSIRKGNQGKNGGSK